MAVGEPPLKAAIKWIDEQFRDNPGADRVKLLDEAARRFDLSPLEEDFLHTVDAYELFLRHLDPEGILSVTTWLSTPPRESVRTVLTAGAALRRLGHSPSLSLLVLRSWGTVTVLARPVAFSAGELKRVRALATALGTWASRRKERQPLPPALRKRSPDSRRATPSTSRRWTTRDRTRTTSCG